MEAASSPALALCSSCGEHLCFCSTSLLAMLLRGQFCISTSLALLCSRELVLAVTLEACSAFSAPTATAKTATGAQQLFLQQLAWCEIVLDTRFARTESRRAALSRHLGLSRMEQMMRTTLHHSSRRAKPVCPHCLLALLPSLLGALCILLRAAV